MRLRIGYLPDSLPASVPRALRRLAASALSVEVDWTAGLGAPMIDALRAERIDAVITTLPAPVNGLRITRLGDNGPSPSSPSRTPSPSMPRSRWIGSHRIGSSCSRGRSILRSPMLVVAMCHDAGLSPTS